MYSARRNVKTIYQRKRHTEREKERETHTHTHKENLNNR